MNFIDLKLQQKEIRSKIDNRIKNVLDSNSYILGEEVKDLENQLSIFCGAKHSICCSNGTDAIMLALMALDIGPGDGVITVPFTYIATIEAIAAVGATPILVDVYDSTFNIDVTKIESSDKVIFVTTVMVFNSELEKSISYKIVGEDEADAGKGKISYASPLAKNLIGKFEGDIVKVETPSGLIEYEIEKVEYL